MKTAFEIRLRGMLGVFISFISLLLFFVSDIPYLSTYGDGELSILLSLLGLLMAFISHVFYFADAFRTKTMPYSKITKRLNSIVLLFMILGSLSVFILVGGQHCSDIWSFVIMCSYNIILTFLVIFSVVYDVKKLHSN